MIKRKTMKSVLLDYAKPVNKVATSKAYVYDTEKSVNVCKENRDDVYVEISRCDTELKTKTEAAREQDDAIPIELCMKTKTFAQMEQDDQGAFYYQ